MPTGTPTIQLFNMTSGGTTQTSLKYLNLTGGPVGTAVGGGTRWDFGNDQAGQYSIPKALCLTATSNSISSMGFWLYNQIGNSASAGSYDLYAPSPPWKMRIKVSNTYVDPTTMNPADGTWQDLPHGTGATPLSLDTLIGGGQDGNGPVVAHNTTNVWVLNAYVYVAIFVDPAAPAGIMNGFQWRLTYQYP